MARAGVVLLALIASAPAAFRELPFLNEGAAQEPAAGERAPQAIFDRANELYRQGHFERAASLYRQVLADVPNSIPARYNLGNALYRQGRTGAALQQYLGVLRRAPRDARARNNADVARAKLAADLPVGSRRVMAGPLEPPLGWLSRAELVWVGLAALYLLAAPAALALLRPRARVVAAWGAAFIFLAVAAFGAAAARAWLRRPEALAVASEAEARAGPSSAEPVVLALPEGTGVRVRAERGAWAFVSLPNGLSGWAPRGQIGFIP